MFRRIRDFFTRWFRRADPKATIIITKPVFPPQPAISPKRTRRPRAPRGGCGPEYRGPHVEPCVLVHTTAPYRLYKQVEDHPAALTWLAGRPGVIEHVNGYGQVLLRERV